MYYLQPSVGGAYCLLFLLFLHHAPTPTNAQGALHLQLASDCTVCITVDSAEGEFAVLQKGDCQTTAPRDKLWLMAQDASAGGGWWCLEDNPNLCVEEGGTLLLSAESETSPYQQFAFTEALRSKTGGLIIGGESDDCVTMVTGGVLMNDCAADGDAPARQLWKAVDNGAPLCPDVEDSGGTVGGGGGGGFIGDETTLSDASRILMYLENNCDRCIGVEVAEAGSPLKLMSCTDTPGILTLWSFDLLVGSSIAQSVCLESNSDLCIVETMDEDSNEIQLRLGFRPKSAYIMNKFIDDQIESLEEVGNCISFFGGDSIGLDKCSTFKSGQYWSKQVSISFDIHIFRCYIILGQFFSLEPHISCIHIFYLLQGEAFWTRQCGTAPITTPRPTAKPTRGPAPPSPMSEEVPWWSMLLTILGAFLVGTAVYYLASFYLASTRHRLDRARTSSRLSRQSDQSPEEIHSMTQAEIS